jgi:flagellar FliJ protein
MTMYTFKLQAVLDHRQFVEDHLKKELAAIKQQLLDARQLLDGLNRKAMTTTTALKQEQRNGLSSDQVVAYHAYLQRLSDKISRQETITSEIASREAETQADLLDAVKKRQILEKLKEKRLDRHNRALFKKEMAFIDEMALNQFTRKTANRNGDGQ